MNKDSQEISPYFDPITQEILSRGLFLRLKVSGRSMQPFIRTDDTLLVEPKDGVKFNIGDILFYRHPLGYYIAHRLIKKNGQDTLLTRGDNLRHFDQPVLIEQVMGRVTQIERGTKRLILTRGLGRVFGCLIAWLARGHYPSQIRLMRNMGRVYWLTGGRRAT